MANLLAQFPANYSVACTLLSLWNLPGSTHITCVTLQSEIAVMAELTQMCPLPQEARLHLGCLCGARAPQKGNHPCRRLVGQTPKTSMPKVCKYSCRA